MSSSVTAQLTQLFKTHRILTIKQLQDFSGRSRRTLFRDMSQLTYLSSYTHAGKYYTLQSIAQFNSNGLWFFQGVGFSQYSTLKVTLVQKIHGSQAGYTQKELSRLLRIRVHDPLRTLVQSKKIQRQLLPERVYLYLSHDERQAQKQVNQRMSLQKVSLEHLPSIENRIEILAETIRCCGLQKGLKVEWVAEELVPGLRHRGVSVTCKDIETVLAFYDIKKIGKSLN
jgi:hypothetical protein